MKIIPIFKSHYSIGRSILTLEKKGSSAPNGSDSIIDICSENNIKSLVLIDDNFSGFIEAYKNSQNIGVQLIYGLRLTCTYDCSEKTEASISTEHKICIMAKNKNGYSKLIKIYSDAATEYGFYYQPRVDFKLLSKYWNDNDLDLWVPFYDSYLYNNILFSYNCIPNFSFTNNIKYLYQDNNLPIDSVIQSRLLNKNVELINSKNIYYKNRKDFQAYLAFRCINNRTSISKPQMDGMSSNEFCIESWREKEDET